MLSLQGLHELALTVHNTLSQESCYQCQESRASRAKSQELDERVKRSVRVKNYSSNAYKASLYTFT